MERELKRSRAKGDDARVHVVIQYATSVSIRTLSGERCDRIFGYGYALTDGRDLNLIEDGVFEIVDSGEIIRAF